jgi:outer membrane lipoprotein-sorting protein
MNFFFIAVLVYALLGPAGPAQAVTASYDQYVTLNGTPVAEIKVLVKGSWLKAESNFEGLQIIMLRNVQGIFSYYPAQKTATQIPREMDAPNVTVQIPDYARFLNENKARKVGAETIDGKECDIYKFIEPALQREATAWMWKEKKFPLQIEVLAPQGTTLIQIQNLKIGAEIPNSAFDLPVNTKILDLKAMQEKADPSAPIDLRNPTSPKDGASSPVTNEE